MTQPSAAAYALAAAAAAGAAVWLLASPPPSRLVRVLAQTRPVRDGHRGDERSRSPGTRGLAVTAAGGATWLLVGGVPGAVFAVLGSVALHRWLATLETGAARARRLRAMEDLPVAADLLAACLSSGATLAEAAEVTADAMGGPVGEALSGAVALHELGGDSTSCWAPLVDDAVLAPLGAAILRGVDSGAPMAEVIAWVAEDCRLRRRGDAEEAARRVGVLAAAPIGLCFLPAFVLVGVVPVIVGVADGASGILR